MKTRKKLLISIAVLLSITVLFIMLCVLRRREESNNQDLFITLQEEEQLSEQQQQYKNENVSLFEDTVSPEDDIIVQTQRVDVTNLEVMSERGYSQESIDALLPYLNAYFDYYDPDGGTYTARIDVSGGVHEQYPHFYLVVDMDGTDFLIECIYFKADHEYVFYSDFGDPFEN